MKTFLPVRMFLSIIFLVFVILLVSYFFPWRKINWGNFTLSYIETITVSGLSEKKEKNQVASFSAGVTAYNDSKEKAIEEVDSKISQITNAVKTFGIPDNDIQTQSLSIYQNQDYVYEGDRQKYKPGQWSVSNSINVTLRNIARASELATLLASSGANNVYGPNFSLEDTKETEKALLGEAVNEARKKAEVIASSSGKKLGKIISVSEGGLGNNYGPTFSADYKGMGGGGGIPIEVGTTNIQKSVTVVFEIK